MQETGGREAKEDIYLIMLNKKGRRDFRPARELNPRCLTLQVMHAKRCVTLFYASLGRTNSAIRLGFFNFIFDRIE